MNINSKYSFIDVRSNLISSKNKSILSHPKIVLFGTITSMIKIHASGIIVDNMLMRGYQKKISLALPLLITRLCELVGVLYQEMIDVKIIPTPSRNI